ncbi:hypothetical protein F5Y15DRAFT_8997 [Xylariaceae sp. FL0016]|nr:hypothetical protein F5Y15DRAFT_8997 [Xylariaceae sp. FL0016]
MWTGVRVLQDMRKTAIWRASLFSLFIRLVTSEIRARSSRNIIPTLRIINPAGFSVSPGSGYIPWVSILVSTPGQLPGSVRPRNPTSFWIPYLLATTRCGMYQYGLQGVPARTCLY